MRDITAIDVKMMIQQFLNESNNTHEEIHKYLIYLLYLAGIKLAEKVFPTINLKFPTLIRPLQSCRFCISTDNLTPYWSEMKENLYRGTRTMAFFLRSSVVKMLQI